MGRSTVVVDAVLVAAALATAARLLLPAGGGTRGPLVSRAPIQRGDRLNVPRFSWPLGCRHVVLVVDPDCDACNRSVPLYGMVSAAIENRSDVDLIVLTIGGTVRTREWLERNAIHAKHTVPLNDPGVIGVNEIPTVLLTDGSGEVTDIAQRVLPDDAGRHLLERIANSASRPFLEATHRAAEISSLATDGALSSAIQVMTCGIAPSTGECTDRDRSTSRLTSCPCVLGQS